MPRGTFVDLENVGDVPRVPRIGPPVDEDAREIGELPPDPKIASHLTTPHPGPQGALIPARPPNDLDT